MYDQAYKKIDWLVPEDSAELERRKYIFHQRYSKMIKAVEEKENDARIAKGNSQGNTATNFNRMLDESTKNLLESYQNDNVGSSKAGADGYYDPNENEDCAQFFHKLIKIFKIINFYNLLYTYAQGNNENEQAGNDDN